MRQTFALARWVVFALLCLVTPFSAGASDPTKNALERIYAEYSALQKTPADAEKVFQLDRQIEKTLVDLNKRYSDEKEGMRGENYIKLMEVSRKLWEPKYDAIGVYVEHYSGALAYTEKLLAEAHKLNPNSRYRKFTLYSTILPVEPDFFGLPNVEQAHLYVKEFPNGPYAETVYGMLASFYHDLYKTIRYGEKSAAGSSGCYQGYLEQHPEEANMKKVRETGIEFYQKAIAVAAKENRKVNEYMSDLAALRRGDNDNVVHNCPD